MENNKFRSGHGKYWTGLFLIVAGALWFAYKRGAPLPDWIFTWEFLLIALGILSGIRHRFCNISWLILVGIGSFFLFQKVLVMHGMQEYFWPVFLMILGLFFIFRPKGMYCHRRWHHRRWHNREWVHGAKGEWPPTGFPETVTEEQNGEDTLIIHSVFSGVKRTVISKNFKGGKIDCVFSGAEIDFMQADIQGSVVLYFDEVFGGIKLTVPQSWVVKNEINGVFHSVDDKRSNYGATMDPNKVLILRGDAVFAGIEIRSH
jgi:uncharacterized membrane protein YhaH (DUF805 family)